MRTHMYRSSNRLQIAIKTKSLMTVTIVLILYFSIFTSQVIAISLQQTSNSEIENYNQKMDEISISNNSVYFTKPMKGNIYIKDTYKISISNNNTPIIIGPITLKAETEYQDDFIHVIYRFTDVNGNIFSPDSSHIFRNESNPNYDFYYDTIHFPIPIYPSLPSKFNIEVRAYWLWFYIGSQNMTVYKIF